MGQLLVVKIVPHRSKFFPFRVEHFSEMDGVGEQESRDEVAKVVSIKNKKPS